ncbi:MAG: hypothetical protein ABI626_05340 [Sphingomicrobium sp.]
MTQELIENTVREWVMGNPARGARELARLATASRAQSTRSADEIAEALIRLAGRMEIAQSRAW